MFLSKIFANLRLSGQLCQISQNEVNTISRNLYVHVHKPKPGVKGKSYRRIVHFEENYTIKPLNVTNLAGRDPDTGNLLVPHQNLQLLRKSYFSKEPLAFTSQICAIFIPPP